MWRGEIEVIRVNVAAGRHQSFMALLGNALRRAREDRSRAREDRRRDCNYQRCASLLPLSALRKPFALAPAMLIASVAATASAPLEPPRR